MTLGELVNFSKTLTAEQLDHPLLIEISLDDATRCFAISKELMVVSENQYVSDTAFEAHQDWIKFSKAKRETFELFLKEGEFVLRGNGPLEFREIETTESLIKKTAGFSVPHLKMELE